VVKKSTTRCTLVDQTKELIQQQLQTMEVERQALSAKAEALGQKIKTLRGLLKEIGVDLETPTSPAVPGPEPKGTWHEAADVILKNGGPIELAKLLGVLMEQGFTVQYGALAQHARRSVVAGAWKKTGRGQYGIKEVNAQADEV
jgi:hypothetical protein